MFGANAFGRAYFGQAYTGAAPAIQNKFGAWTSEKLGQSRRPLPMMRGPDTDQIMRLYRRA